MADNKEGSLASSLYKYQRMYYAWNLLIKKIILFEFLKLSKLRIILKIQQNLIWNFEFT